MAAGVQDQAARRSAAGFCAGRRPLNREPCIRRTGRLRGDKPAPEDRCDQRFRLRVSVPLTYHLIRPCSGLNLIVTEFPDMDLMLLRDASREA